MKKESFYGKLSTKVKHTSMIKNYSHQLVRFFAFNLSKVMF